VSQNNNMDINGLRARIKKIISELNIVCLHICIDELSLVDAKNSLGFQPMFLDYIKKIFFGLNNASIKIAAIREATNLYSKVLANNAYGIQNGQDIMELENLDYLMAVVMTG